jgi:(S)-ureidoglycine aminohydrolase
MHELGHTRSVHRVDHLLQTPDTFVRAPLPGMQGAMAVIHIATAGGAAFTQYTAEFEQGGRLGPAIGQRFVYVLEGELDITGRMFTTGHYAYLPPQSDVVISAKNTARAVVIEKPYYDLAGFDAPEFLAGQENRVEARPLMGDDGLQVRTLLPDDPAFDFAVNTMTYQPGASLSMVEIHVMEHGLLMLEGGGIYRLGEHWYPVTAGDFIWMAPYCPQWFGALGKTPAKYLIYKDWNRHPQVDRR